MTEGERTARLELELAAAQASLREQKARLARFTEAINDGVFEWDLDKDEAKLSSRFLGMLDVGGEATTAPASLWRNRIHPDDRGRFEDALARHLRDELDVFQCEHRLRDEAGRYRWMYCRGLCHTDALTGSRTLYGSLTDLTQRGYFDPLTGLPNRILLGDRLQHALERSSREANVTTAVLFMDLNRFKVINDSLGHHVGDLLLIEFAKRLQLCVRSGDTVARLGGDEFVVVLENVEGVDGVMRIVDRIERYTTSMYNLDGNMVASNTSLGIVVDIHRYGSVDAILRDADTAMYHAKERKLSHVLFDESMHLQAVARHETEIELRAALEKGEFTLEYQPIVSLLNGKMECVEALVRWQHPTRGLLNPGEFIDIAEDTGLIVQLGEWVLYEACYQLKAWQDSDAVGVVPVSVNVSGKQLVQPDMVSKVQAVLKATGLDPRLLKLEVTESAIMKDLDDARDKLVALKALGLSISLDDFGTGYSSMSYLRDLPFDIIKIDRSFITNLHADPKSYEIIRTISEMVTSLKMKVVTEGIETFRQLTTLRGTQCEYGQGYLFSRPLTMDDLRQLVGIEFLMQQQEIEDAPELVHEP